MEAPSCRCRLSSAFTETPRDSTSQAPQDSSPAGLVAARGRRAGGAGGQRGRRAAGQAGSRAGGQQGRRAGAHWTCPERGNLRLPDRGKRIPPNVETMTPPNVETSGSPDRGNTGGAGAPNVETCGRLKTAAPAVRSRCSLRLYRRFHDPAYRSRIVGVENPAPILPEPQPLPDCIPPNNGRYRLDSMRRCRVVEAGQRPGILKPLAAPCVQFSCGFDDHSGIIPGRGNERNPRPWKPKNSHDTNCPSNPRT